jgi:beta-phosphoglucomutase-like phosphatase (HAD superfamily)
MKLKALIFDVDGTLTDNEEVHRCSFNQAFAEHGLEWNWSQALYSRLLRVAGGKERLAKYIETIDESSARRAELHAAIGELHASKSTHYARMVGGGLAPLRDGVLRLIDEASRAGIDLAIASATTVANLQALLETQLGPEGLKTFRVIGCDDQVPHKKPAPDIYTWVLTELGLSAGQCVAIEDSNNGLRAAKAAGIFTIVTPSYWTRGEDFSRADLVLPSLGSANRPLPDDIAAMLGNSVLGIREIDRQLRGEIDARS